MLGQLGPYPVVRILGEGSFGTVVQSEDRKLGRPLAIKVLKRKHQGDKETRQRFIHEAQQLARFRHPCIVPVYEVSTDANPPYFTMALLEGPTLQTWAGGAPRDAAEVARVITDIGSALDTLHRAGLVHRDVKPANIILDTASGHAVLLDLGIARAPSRPYHVARSHLTLTPECASPEQAAGDAVTYRSDIYALAVVTFFLLTGRMPFVGPNPESVLRMHITAVPPSLMALRPDLPPGVYAAVGTALAKQPDQRQESAGRFAQAIVESLGMWVSVPPVTAPSPASAGQASPTSAAPTVPAPARTTYAPRVGLHRTRPARFPLGWKTAQVTVAVVAPAQLLVLISLAFRTRGAGGAAIGFDWPETPVMVLSGLALATAGFAAVELLDGFAHPGRYGSGAVQAAPIARLVAHLELIGLAVAPLLTLLLLASLVQAAGGWLGGAAALLTTGGAALASVAFFRRLVRLSERNPVCDWPLYLATCIWALATLGMLLVLLRNPTLNA